MSAENAFAAKARGPATAPYAAVLSRLQAAVRANDRRAIIATIAFPLRVNDAGAVRYYRDAQSVERDFDRIFTARVRRSILRQRPDRLVVRDQGAMIGKGEVWLGPPPGPARIAAVTP